MYMLRLWTQLRVEEKQFKCIAEIEPQSHIGLMEMAHQLITEIAK